MIRHEGYQGADGDAVFEDEPSAIEEDGGGGGGEDGAGHGSHEE